MRHLVLGHTGNLGADLLESLRLKEFELLKPIETKYPNPNFVDVIQYYKPDVIWNTIGVGSVAESQADPWKAYDTHACMPMKLALALPNSLIITFSSSFVASGEDRTNPRLMEEFPKSLYSFSKQAMERACITSKHGNLRAIRVTNLYGAKRPDKCFPGRIAASTQVLPTNIVVPTPTNHLADILTNNIDKIKNTDYPVLNASPKGSCTVAEWGRLLYPHIKDGDLDPNRPESCEIGSSFEWNEDWKTLWLQFIASHGRLFNKETI